VKARLGGEVGGGFCRVGLKFCLTEVSLHAVTNRFEPAVARKGSLDKIQGLLDGIRWCNDKIMVKISNRLVTACRLTSVTPSFSSQNLEF